VVPLALFGWFLEAGSLECVTSCLAGFPLFACNVFRGGSEHFKKSFKHSYVTYVTYNF
jgi:hypothetical protein